MKKFFASVLTIIIFSIFLSSCASKNAYRNDIACSEITDALINELNTDGGYVYYDTEQMKLIFEDLDDAEEYSAAYSLLSQNIDEFGIFRASNEKNAKDILENCRDYLKDKYEDQQAFISSYAPEELPKLKYAEVKVYGNYVAFAVLSQSDRSLFFEKLEEILNPLCKAVYNGFTEGSILFKNNDQCNVPAPLTKIVSPESQLASSDERNAATEAISSGLPRRCAGSPLIILVSISSPTARIISVSMQPGAIQFIRTFLRPSSFAIVRVKPSRAALEAA